MSELVSDNINRYSPFYDPDEQRVKMSIDADGSWVHITAYKAQTATLEALKAELERLRLYEQKCAPDPAAPKISPPLKTTRSPEPERLSPLEALEREINRIRHPDNALTASQLSEALFHARRAAGEVL